MTRTLYHLLAYAAERRPDHPALRMDGVDLSYAALVARANAIARCLVEQGLERPDRVALFMTRSFDAMAAIFGVMQAGGVYMPMDTHSPIARTVAMLRNGGVRFVICSATAADLVRQLAAELPELRFVVGLPEGALPVASIGWPSVWRAFDVPLADRGLVETDLSVMFHTSGSTGTPKGVVHSHRSMLSNVEWAVRQFGLTRDDRFSTVTAHHFELSWLELYASKAVQATAILAPEETVSFAPAELVALTGRERVSIWCSVPSVLMRVSERGSSETADLGALRWVLFAGERFPTKHLRRLMGQLPAPRYCNMLGTTETHICAFWEVTTLPEAMTQPIPVGKACGHVNLFALSPDGHIVPDGETGELAVRGPSLMEGYWQLPERTAQAMVAVPISGDLVARCYRTGDLVRKDGEGNFHIIGRANRRIKVQGNLVDLDEVETVLLSEPRVRETAAFEVELDGGSHVEAAVVPKPDAAPVTGAELRVHVARVLPAYAVPERVTVVEDLPRTGSGKLSRRDLQDRAEAAARAEAAERAAARPAAGHRTETDTLMTALRGFIVDELQAEPGTDLAEDDDLLEPHRLGSIGVMRLVEHVEQQLAVRIPNDEFVAANFQHLKAIRALIERLR